jgi:hypothetical protein
MSAQGKDLYVSLVAIASDYLGPAGERFIDRQMQNLLKKNPAELTTDDIDTLIDWSRIALTVITDKKEVIAEFIDRIAALKTGDKA